MYTIPSLNQFRSDTVERAIDQCAWEHGKAYAISADAMHTLLCGSSDSVTALVNAMRDDFVHKHEARIVATCGVIEAQPVQVTHA